MKRISVDLEEELYADLCKYIPHGFRKHVLHVLIKLVVSAIKENGNVMIGALMSGDFKLVKDIQSE